MKDEPSKRRSVSIEDLEADPRLVPPELVIGTPGGGWCFSFREGGTMKLQRANHPLSALFILALSASGALDSQPVRCSGLMPGISLRIKTTTPPAAQCNPDWLAEEAWRQVQPLLNEWLTAPGAAPSVDIEFSGPDVFIAVTFARDALLQLHPGVMEIECGD